MILDADDPRVESIKDRQAPCGCRIRGIQLKNGILRIVTLQHCPEHRQGSDPGAAS